MNNITAPPARYTSRLALPVALALVAAFANPAQAVALIKANNTTALNLAGSYTAGGPPTIADTVTWNNTVAGANTVALGGNLSMLGIVVADPGGAVVVTHASGNVLTLGASGLDLSAATQNLTLLNSDAACNLDISASQVWNIASGRTLTLFETDNGKNERLTGSGNIEVTGAGTVNLNIGDAGSTSFTAGNGMDTYTGNWTITGGTVKSLRNGTHAWGQGTITLNGGTIAQNQGSWTWANNIILNTSTTSTINDLNTSGTTRFMKLQGVISGNGNVNFNDTANRMNAENGYILTGANTLSGTVTLGASGDVRIGGVPGNDTTTGAGSSGTLGTASVNLSEASSTLTLSRNDAWTFPNTVSGTGALRIGGAVTGAGTQVVTVSGTNSHSGATTINSGKMIGVTGGSCSNSAVTVASGATIGVKLATAGGTWSCTNLTFNSTTTTAEFDFNNKAPSTTIAPLQVAANMLNSGTLNVTILNGIFAATDYPLIKTTGGTLTPGTLGTVTIGGGAVAALTSDATTIYLSVTIATPVTYFWGAGTGTWDLLTTASWNYAADGSSTETYADGQPTIFNDTATGTGPFTVTLDESVSPDSLTVNNPTKDYTISGTGEIAGSTGLTKQGAGKLTLSTVNTFSGATAVSGGTLSIGSDSNLGTAPGSATAGSLVLDGGALSASASLTLAANRGLALGPTSGSGSGTIDVASSQTLTYGGIAANNGGTGSLAKTGSGTLAISGVNTYGGATTVSDGTLAVSGGSAIPNGSTVSISSGAAFQVNASETISGLSTVSGSTVNAAGGTLTFTTGSILGNLTGAGTVLRNGTSDTVFGQFIGTDALNFTGTIQLRGSTPSTSPSAMQGGTGRFWLHSTNGSQAVGTAFALDTGASGTDAQDFIIGDWDGTSGNRKLTLSSLTGYGTLRTDAGDTGTRQLIVDQSGGDTTFNGMLLSHTSGSGQVRSIAFEKKGSSKLTMAGIIGKETAASGPANADVAITVTAGTLELAAANTATGPIVINGGTLALGAAGTIANVPTITVASGGVFDVSGTTFTLGAAQTLRGGGSVVGTMINDGKITPGTSIDTLTFSTAPTLNGGGSITAEIDRNGGSPLADKIVISSGALTFGGTLTLTNIGSTLQAGDTFDLFDGSLSGTFTTLNLPGGPGHWNTGDLNSGGTISFSGNAAPVAQSLTLGCALGASVSFQVIGGKHAPTDADGDTMTVTSVTAASSGTSGSTSSNVTYQANGTLGTNTFTYTVTDALGATDTETVTVIVHAAEGFNKLSGPTGGGPWSFSYLGIPGEDYALQETEDLPATGSSIWTSVVTNTASGTGAVEFSGVTLSHPSGSFRTRHVAP